MFKDLLIKLEDAIIDENVEIIESESEYQLCQKLKSSKLQKILDLDLALYYAYFNASVRITINNNGEVTVFHSRKGIDFLIKEFSQLINENCEIIFIFNINKNQFIEEKAAVRMRNEFTIRIFKSAQAFSTYLNDSSMFFIQNHLFEKDKILLLIVPDIEFSINNNVFYIVNSIDGLQSISFENSKDSLGVLSERSKQREKELGWKDEINFITPDYFYFPNINNLVLEPILNRKMVDCILIYLANGIKSEDCNYLLQFNGYKCTSLILTEALNPDLLKLNCYTTFDLYNWTYDSYFLDKIMIVRNIISKFLRENEKSNYSNFLFNVSEIYNACKSNYQIFFQSKIDAFFDDRKKIAQYTFDKTKEVEKEISNLIDAMTKNVVTAVGVVLAAVIANAAKGQEGAIGIKVAIGAYLFYLGISIIYNLVTPVISMIQQCSGNSHLIKYYTTFVPEDEIKQIQGNIFKNKRNFFWVYWGLSVLLMGVLVGASIYAIINSDKLLKLI